jgi:hypothetical protein
VSALPSSTPSQKQLPSTTASISKAGEASPELQSESESPPTSELFRSPTEKTKKRKERPTDSGPQQQEEEGNKDIVCGHKDNASNGNGTGKVISTTDKETSSPPAKQARTLSPAKEQTNQPDSSNNNNNNISSPASSLRQSSVSVNPRQPQPQQTQSLAWQQAPKVSNKSGSAIFRSSTEKSLSPLPATNTTTTMNRTPEKVKENEKSNTSAIDLSAEKAKEPSTNNEKSSSSSILSPIPAVPSKAPVSSSQLEQPQSQQNEKSATVVAKRPSASSKIMNAVTSAVNQSLEKEQPGAASISTGTTNNNTSIPPPPAPPRVPRPAVTTTATTTSSTAAAVPPTTESVSILSLSPRSLPQKDTSQNNNGKTATSTARGSPSTVTTTQPQQQTQAPLEASQANEDNNTVANTSVGGADVAATATISSLTNTATAAGGETQTTAAGDDANLVTLVLRFDDHTSPLQSLAKGFRTGRTKTFKKLMKVVAGMIHRNPADLILEFNGKVLENHNTRTPNDFGLGMMDVIIVSDRTENNQTSSNSNSNNNVVDLT